MSSTSPTSSDVPPPRFNLKIIDSVRKEHDTSEKGRYERNPIPVPQGWTKFRLTFDNNYPRSETQKNIREEFLLHEKRDITLIFKPQNPGPDNQKDVKPEIGVAEDPKEFNLGEEYYLKPGTWLFRPFGDFYFKRVNDKEETIFIGDCRFDVDFWLEVFPSTEGFVGEEPEVKPPPYFIREELDRRSLPRH